MKSLSVQELTWEKFAKYGMFANMVSPSGERIGVPPIEFYRDMCVVCAPGEHVGLSVTKVYKRPLEIRVAEYHDTCGEAMMPLDGDVLIHVAPATANGVVPYDAFEVFRVPQGTLVTLRPGVWHHGPFCVDTESVSTLIVLPERTYVKDCKVIEFPEDQYIRILP